jgi:23S rRNA pseudouridine1911/1915/1917 synthase
MKPFTVTVDEQQAGQTLAALVRAQLPDRSWSQVRRLILQRHVCIGAEVCLDPARRLRRGEVVRLSVARQRSTLEGLPPQVVVRFVDEHVVVVEKPAGINTVRHPSERHWSQRRRQLSPTLEDLIPRTLQRLTHTPSHAQPRLRCVHRLDKATSGLVVFARSPLAQVELGKQFAAHRVLRQYLAVVRGAVAAGRIESYLVRDRGDGRRGSTTVPGLGKHAVTHFEPLAQVGELTLLSCRLETGRTHQIRIHLAEAGTPVCGEMVYTTPAAADHATATETMPHQTMPPRTMPSGLPPPPRLALHAAELGFSHPRTGEPMYWNMPLPQDLANWLISLGWTMELLRSFPQHGAGVQQT